MCGLYEINKINRAYATHGLSLVQKMFRDGTEAMLDWRDAGPGPGHVLTLYYQALCDYCAAVVFNCICMLWLQMCSVEEKKAIDQIIDSGPRPAGEMDFTVLHGLSLLSVFYIHSLIMCFILISHCYQCVVFTVSSCALFLSVILLFLDNSGRSWTVSVPDKVTAVPVRRNGNFQTPISVPVVRHFVASCPQTRLHGGLSKLHSADDDAVAWLTSYGS